ncbi:MAG: 2-C-methyl-D-erythritol 4-phosphate cytidylyltransferase [Limnobacter sp.]|jgi:2-C-methyl-D-erythritol 4-phosphate cytidylyltransferase|uniref:2-C-methyl-D-erythritol 4-phosphate cytidylyltransferase n=1 Tax=Limnobacter profundi TaxID=2732163 RepID=A0ABX6N632_9BURK|nr:MULTISPECIES: 2-C-methyl-D-erythritol 4-phosphate cytidylyltransferase [unclassified Limnobacter]MAG80802.1 2-C-methyl-D-erythritol 4-phosphate cytidylyltransferase [Sutterellaceae bacterium]MBA4315542.1 2-C-methyl-D-erythritol 4-phosphate cytidylyltransferase [Alcaligenaceae bacterium]PZO15409.1 MAG: 2-C-methyl-D-erythritol 4-phosphate cytidylyltransferase [Betaproteobacteria bacterium]MBT83654.1 2-C-methyl-D-erythritol 4-phosphate cytidylyltransferase [Sutterellaceae bacterium]MDZ4048991.|tara:strand:+ start:606 stop:1337 length:732 start_codon:yes stop_codon:yes gene_type:complete
MARIAKYFGLVPAGGAGRRFGGSIPKQYAMLGAKTVLEHSVEALLADPRVEKVFVVVASDDSTALALFRGNSQVTCLPLGGQERVNSVLNGLNHLLENLLVGETDWVLVHDAARPGLSAAALKSLIDQGSEHIAGALLAVPVADTLKRTSLAQEGEVIAQHTVPRDHLWAAQTPQMFRAQALSMAISECLYKGAQLTDDASAIETLGIGPLIVPGHVENMKITQAEDLRTVARLLGLHQENFE